MGGVLLTGFEPFDGWAVNSSWEAVRRLAGRPGVAVARLPVDHGRAAEAIGALVAELAPAAVLLTGLTPEPRPRLERIGRAGLLGARGGPPVRLGRWPFVRALGRARARGVPLGLSEDAGGYVCDTTYWAALGTPVPRVAFLHLPPLGAAWPAERGARVVECVLGALGD